MKVTRRFARRFRLLELLRGALGLGGLFNLLVAVLLVASPEALGRLTGLPPEIFRGESEPVLRWLLAALLTPLALLYWLAARDPRRYSGVILVVITGRLMGAVALGAAALHRPDLGGLWAMAGTDLAFATVIAGAWLPLRVP